MVEVSQYVWAAAVQGAPELGNLFQSGGYPASDRVDQCRHCFLAALAVRVGVGGDDLLVDQPGDLDGEVLVGVELSIVSPLASQHMPYRRGDPANG